MLSHGLDLASKSSDFDHNSFIREHIGDGNDQFECFEHALTYKNFDLLRALVNEAKINPDGLKDATSGKSVVHLAVEKGQALMVHFLGELGVDLNVRDKKGNTPLHLAIESNQVFLARFLLSMGVDYKVKNDEGNTPLH